MSALTQDRATVQMNPNAIIPSKLNFPVAASVKIYNGAIVVLDSSGNAKPGVAGTGLTCVGRALQQADNSSGLAGAIKVDVEQGVFWYANSGGGDAIAAANVGQLCYVVDDQTVALTKGGEARSIAGTIVAVDSTKGVAVHMQLSGALSASSVTPSVIACPVPAYSAIADAGVLLRLTPGFAGRILGMHLQCTTPVTTAAKGTTLTPKIAGNAVTGGVVTATSAGQNAIGAVQDGTAVTGANTFTASQEITVVASNTTAFAEGAGVIYLVLG